MRFIIGEGGWSYLDRLSYRGVIGLFFDNTFTGLLSYLIALAIAVFTIIGIGTVIKWIVSRKNKKK